MTEKPYNLTFDGNGYVDPWRSGTTGKGVEEIRLVDTVWDEFDSVYVHPGILRCWYEEER